MPYCIVFLQESVPTTYKEVCALSNAPRKKVVHSQKQIVAALGLQVLVTLYPYPTSFSLVSWLNFPCSHLAGDYHTMWGGSNDVPKH
jgi:hypothetical protein